MNTIQESHQRMYRKVFSFSNENKDLTGGLPGYLENLGKLEITVVAIQVAAEEQKLDSKGITKYKLQARNQLSTLGADTARKLTSFAKLTNNTVLLGKVSLTETDFKRFSDEALKDYAQIIYNAAEPIVSELANYDVTADTQAQFLSAIDIYNEVLASPNIAETIKKQATEKLARLIIEGDGYVAKMAIAVEIVKLKEPIFYLGFKTAQKITVRGKVKLSLKGQTVTVNGEAVAYVTFTATLNGEVILTRKTSKKGGFNQKSMAAGTYQFTFKKAGLADQTLNVVVNDGELTRIKVIMVKA